MSGPVLGGFHICRPKTITVQGCGSEQKPVGLRLMSDLHIGAANVDYKLIDKEIWNAKDTGDRVLINGDVFDLILPKDHKRYTADVVHPRIASCPDQVDKAVDWAFDLFAPIADQIDMIGVGNHETAVTKYHGVDPVMRLLIKLEDEAKKKVPDHHISYGGFTGFVDYRFSDDYSRKRTGGGVRYVVYYHHGSGANAPVTKGLIDFNRRDTFIDADVIWMGHKHNRLTVAVEKLSCPLFGDNLKVRQVRHIMTGAYFNTYVNQTQKSVRRYGRRSNYAADAGFAPQGKGGARVLLWFDRKFNLSMQVVQ